MTGPSSHSNDSDDSSDSGPALPVKRCYRQRAHCNPWSDHTLDYPVRPDAFDWENVFSFRSGRDLAVRFVDVGCGYGGLLFKLAVRFPHIRSLGLELRLKVSDYVQEKIRALRKSTPGHFGNIACIRTNAMKFLPNFFEKGQLHKLFFLYPDPHFKRGKHKWRIISPTLLDIYAYILRPGGHLYTTTDVLDLAVWMSNCLSNHPLFDLVLCSQFAPSSDGKSLQFQEFCEQLTVDKKLFVDQPDKYDMFAAQDIVLELFLHCSTDEAMKATREGRKTTLLVYVRRPNP